VQAALFAPAELTIRFVDAEEGRTLNREYREKDYATNVLTFAYNEGEEFAEDEPTRADIILCTDVLEKEAAEQKKTVEEHAAHLIVHGVLHAQGYDHMDDEEAAEMEGIETECWRRSATPIPTPERPIGVVKLTKSADHSHLVYPMAFETTAHASYARAL
jgi:probable rRNA maturation factor